MATSSWLVAPFEPLVAVTPTISKLVPSSSIVCAHRVLAIPNSSLATVGPTTSTRRLFCTVGLVNHLPSAIVVAAGRLVGGRRARRTWMAIVVVARGQRHVGRVTTGAEALTSVPELVLERVASATVRPVLAVRDRASEQASEGRRAADR